MKKKHKYNVLNWEGKKSRLYLEEKIEGALVNITVNGVRYGVIQEGCACNCIWLVTPYEVCNPPERT